MDAGVRYQYDAHIATITIDRPPRRNALASMTGLADAFVAAGSHPNVRLILLTGSGAAAFSADADLKEADELANAGDPIRCPCRGRSGMCLSGLSRGQSRLSLRSSALPLERDASWHSPVTFGLPRLKQVSLTEVTDERVRATYLKHYEGRDPVAYPGTKGGTPANWWTVYALDPELFGMFLNRHKWQWSENGTLDPILRELSIIRAGWARCSRFMFSQHCKVLRREGCPEEKIQAIPAWSSCSAYSPIERAVLGYADDLILGDGRSSDQRFSEPRQSLRDLQIFELTFMDLTYETSAKLCKALRLEYDDVEGRVTESRRANTTSSVCSKSSLATT